MVRRICHTTQRRRQSPQSSQLQEPQSGQPVRSCPWLDLTIDPAVLAIIKQIIIYLDVAQPAQSTTIAADLRIAATSVENALLCQIGQRVCVRTTRGWRLRYNEQQDQLDGISSDWNDDSVTPEIIQKRKREVQLGQAIDQETGRQMPAWTERTYRKRAGCPLIPCNSQEIQPVSITTQAPRQQSTQVLTIGE